MRHNRSSPGIAQHLLSGRGIAKFLGISHSSVYRQTKLGELPSIRIGSCVRYDPEDVLTFLKARANVDAKQSKDTES